MMKTRLPMGLLLVLSTISCTKQEPPDEKTVTTTFMGTFMDMERNRPLANHPVYVSRTYSCGEFLTTGTCYEVIDSTRTDSQGNYTITFPAKTFGSSYSIGNAALPNCEELYAREEVAPQPPILGQSNIINFDIWCPVVLKLNLQLSNNGNPPLLVHTHTNDPENPNFPDVELNQIETDTILYLYTKPNHKTNLAFQYQLQNENANHHVTNEWFEVGIQDTLELSRVLDCRDF